MAGRYPTHADFNSLIEGCGHSAAGGALTVDEIGAATPGDREGEDSRHAHRAQASRPDSRAAGPRYEVTPRLLDESVDSLAGRVRRASAAGPVASWNRW